VDILLNKTSSPERIYRQCRKIPGEGHGLVAQVKEQTADKAIAGDILMAGNQPLNG
jgi:hypothetical protein